MAHRAIIILPKAISVTCGNCGCKTQITQTDQVCYDNIPLPGFGTHTPFYTVCSVCGRYIELCDGSGRVGIPTEQDPIRSFLLPYYHQHFFLHKQDFTGRNQVVGTRKVAKFRPEMNTTCHSCGVVITISSTTDIRFRAEGHGEMGTVISFVTNCPVCRYTTVIGGHYKILQRLYHEGYFQDSFPN